MEKWIKSGSKMCISVNRDPLWIPPRTIPNHAGCQVAGCPTVVWEELIAKIEYLNHCLYSRSSHLGHWHGDQEFFRYENLHTVPSGEIFFPVCPTQSVWLLGSVQAPPTTCTPNIMATPHLPSSQHKTSVWSSTDRQLISRLVIHNLPLTFETTELVFNYVFRWRHNEWPGSSIHILKLSLISTQKGK